MAGIQRYWTASYSSLNLKIGGRKY